MNEIMEKLALDMYDCNNKIITFKNDGFEFNYHKQYPDAPKSPLYFSLRNVVRDHGIRNRLADLIAPYVQIIEPDLLVDLPQSITPLVTTISDKTYIPIISILSEFLKNGVKKDHGIDSIIDGKFRPKEHALIIDDILSGFAFTKFKAIDILLRAGLQITGVIVLVVVDREEGGDSSLSRMGYKSVSLYKLEKILQLYLKKDIITKEQFFAWKDSQTKIKSYVSIKD